MSLGDTEHGFKCFPISIGDAKKELLAQAPQNRGTEVLAKGYSGELSAEEIKSDLPAALLELDQQHRNRVLSCERNPIQIQNVLRSLPSDAAVRKNAPVVTGMVDYFPLAIAEIAKISKAGNDQHNPGQPLHWARDKSKDHADCVLRHLIERGTRDSDGQRHTAKAAWRMLALLQEELEAAAGWTPEAAA